MVFKCATATYRTERNYQLDAFQQPAVTANVRNYFQQLESMGVFASQAQLNRAVLKEVSVQTICGVISIAFFGLTLAQCNRRWKAATLSLAAALFPAIGLDSWTAVKQHRRIPVFSTVMDGYGRVAIHLASLSFMAGMVVMYVRSIKLGQGNQLAPIITVSSVAGITCMERTESNLRSWAERRANERIHSREAIFQRAVRLATLLEEFPVDQLELAQFKQVYDQLESLCNEMKLLLKQPDYSDPNSRVIDEQAALVVGQRLYTYVTQFADRSFEMTTTVEELREIFGDDESRVTNLVGFCLIRDTDPNYTAARAWQSAWSLKAVDREISEEDA